ncbi:MAG TPA: vanadium-dependent haloperoxidase [Candidatus Angelobacter sp.]
MPKKNPKVSSEETLAAGGEQTPDSRNTDPNLPDDPSRRSFLSKAGGLTAFALASAIVPLEPLLSGKKSRAEASVITYKSNQRSSDAFSYRSTEAHNEQINIGVLPDNGDAAKFTDHSGTWTKTLKHTSLEIVDPTSYNSLVTALTSGSFTDFQNIIVGNPGGSNPTATLNGPQGSLAFDLEGLDSHATNIPPAPSVTSNVTAAEQVEHYWAALLRDVNFTDYGTNSVVAQAVQDMNNLSFVKGTANNEYPFPVTAQNLFRGQVFKGDGNVLGPYISQFMVQPTFFGALPVTQRFQTFLPRGGGGNDFMTTVQEFTNVQNGFKPSASLVFDPTLRFLRNGRDLAAYTHVDVLYQEFLIAFLILAGLGAPPNPGDPYIGSKSEHGFGTLGGPDAAGTIAEMATRALKAAWFHKWIVNLRQRPEEYGGLVQAKKTNANPFPQAAGQLHSDIFSSSVLPIINNTFGSYLLPQAFPEGAPSHPCYPTGHGTVAGACITAIKFFFDCTQKIRPLLLAAATDVMQPSEDGTSLVAYTGTDRDSLDINGELSKLAFNVSFGHGIHAGIHFRSSTLQSILLGEQVAISVLQDRADGYNEPFSITITKFDGTTVTITNHGISPSANTTTTCTA